MCICCWPSGQEPSVGARLFQSLRLMLDIFETPVTVTPQQKISETLNSSKIPWKYLMFTFGEITFTLGDITFTLGETTFTLGEIRFTLGDLGFLEFDSFAGGLGVSVGRHLGWEVYVTTSPKPSPTPDSRCFWELCVRLEGNIPPSVIWLLDSTRCCGFPSVCHMWCCFTFMTCMFLIIFVVLSFFNVSGHPAPTKLLLRRVTFWPARVQTNRSRGLII